jgi:hypothetical protein
MREIEHVVPGNKECIAGLEKVMERARNGMVRCISVVFCEGAGADVMYLGDVEARPQVVYGCNLMIQMLVTSTSMNVRPMDETRPANLVRYDVTADPICFDFLPWLVTAEMRRRQEGAPAPLKVAFVRNPASLAPLTEAKWQFFAKVMRPCLELLGAEESQEAQNGRHEDFVGLREIAKLARSGIEVPHIKVPDEQMNAMREQLGNKKPVTITLREKRGAFDHRNSDLAEWDKFAVWLSRKKGEHVVVVRDTEYATETFGNFDICPDASKDLLMRAALYEQSKCNMFVTNGPWGLAQYSDVPWLMFASIDKDQPEVFNRPEWWDQFMGLNEDRQLAWAGPQQRIVYKRDTFENMRDAYEQLRL